MIFRITDQCLHTDLTLLVALKLQSTTRRQTLYRFLCYRLINFFFFTYLVIFLKLVNELSVISQTGCKDTDFFLSSKFFWHFFWFFLQFILTPTPKPLILNNITTTMHTNQLIHNDLRLSLAGKRPRAIQLKRRYTTTYAEHTPFMQKSQILSLIL